MKKRLITIPFLLVLLLNLASLLSVSAYTVSSSFYTFSIGRGVSEYFSFEFDGVLLLHSFFRTSVDVQSLPPSERNLDLTSFTSGTWQGSPVSELSSSRLCDQSDTVGFSQTVSYSYKNGYYVYSVLTCLPCVKGDSFYLQRIDSPYSFDSITYSRVSVLPGVTGIKKIYTDSSQFYTDETISYTTKTDNQYLICLFTSDYTPSSSDFSFSSSDLVGKDYSNITRICSSRYASVYTSNYGLDKGVDLSLHLVEDTNSWNFAVYELYTDGKYYPGYDDGSVDDDGEGDSNSSADLSNIEQYLQEIIEILKAGAAPPDPHEFWEVYRDGLIELFGFQSSESEEPAEPPPEESEGEEPTENTPSFDIDQEQFDSALEYVNSEDLGESITGSSGVVSFFWYVTDRFLTSTNLYTVVAISLVLCLATWLLRS